ncbi:MAG: hypothetical protein EZS28_012435, partial [Streblomastix strix]
MAHRHHNHPNDNDDDESANSDAGHQVQAPVQIPFDDFVNTIDVESDEDENKDEDEDYTAQPIQQSSDDDHHSMYSASDDEEIRNAQCFPRLRISLEADGDASSSSERERESEAEIVSDIKRRRLLEDESEDNQEKQDSDSISLQDTETKQWLQKLAPILDHDTLGPELDEDHIRAFKVRSRVDLTPLNTMMPHRIVDGKRFSQIGGKVRNLVAAQYIGIIAIESIFKKAKRKHQSKCKTCLSQRNQVSSNRSTVSAALSSKDKKAWKENKSISMNTSRSLSRKRGVNVELNKTIQPQTESKSSHSIYQLRNQQNNDEHTRLQRQNVTVHNKRPDQVAFDDVLTNQKAKWEVIGASQVLTEGAQANWKDVEAPVQLKKRLKPQEFQGTQEEKKIYIEALQEEIQQGVVTRIPKEEVLFLNRTFLIPKKDGRKRKILDCRQVNKYLQDISFKGEDFKKVANITLRGEWA